MPTPTLTNGNGQKEDNPGQQDWNNRTENGLYQSERQGTAGTDSAFQDIADNYDRDADPSQENANIEKLNAAEQEGAPEGGWQNNTSGSNGGDSQKPTLRDRALKLVKKRGGVIGIIGGLGVGGILIASFLAPSSLLVNLMENLIETNDSASTSMQQRFMRVFGFATGGDPICANVSNSKNMKCKMGRISNKALDQLSKKGVTPIFDDDVQNKDTKKGYPSRNPKGYTVDLGNGQTANVNANDLPGFLAKNPKVAAKVLGTSGAFNLRVKAWTGKYLSKKLLGPMGLKKNGGLADGEHENANGGSRANATLAKLRAKIPGLEKLSGAKEAVTKKIDGHLGKAKKGGMAYTLTVAGCVAVKAPGYIAAGVAAIQLAQIIGIAHDTILSPGSKLKATAVEGDKGITNEDVDAIGSLLTERTPNESDGELASALDSPLLLMALGINKNKATVSKDYTPGYSVLTSKEVRAAQQADASTEAACNVIMSPAAMWAAFAVDSAVTVALSATVVGGLAKLVAGWAVSEVIAGVTKTVLGAAADQAITDLAKNDKLPTASGKALGDVLGISAMSFFSSGGMARNLPVLKRSQLAGYTAVKQEVTDFERQMAVASLSPFDVSSKYTFLGSIVNKTQMAMVANGSSISPLSILSSLPSLALPNSLNAAAAAEQDAALCGYAGDFFLSATNPDDSPAINAAGLPCTGLTSDQAAMSTGEAITLIQDEGWLDESKTIKDSDTIDDLVASGYIKADTPLHDFITTCGDATTGDYLFNAAGCTVSSNVGDPSLSSNIGDYCTTGTEDSEGVCVSDGGYDGGEAVEGVKNPRALIAMSVFLLDYQSIQSINGEDEGTAGSVTEPADISFDPTKLYESSVDIGCATGTEDRGTDTAYMNGQPFEIRLCALPNTDEPSREGGVGVVNSRVSGAAYAMMEKMKTDLGMERIPLGDSFRTMAQQEEAKRIYGGQAADPGYSNHQSGIAFDFEYTNAYCVHRMGITSCPASPIWSWLNTNAATYGFKQLQSEWWHWNP